MIIKKVTNLWHFVFEESMIHNPVVAFDTDTYYNESILRADWFYFTIRSCLFNQFGNEI